jgi:leader peptidase (prepilin peptidase)/N-methyltransferase
MTWRYGPGLEAVRWAVFGTLLVGIAMTDAREFIIPHEFSFGGLAAGIILSVGGGMGGVLSAVDGAIFGAGLVYLIGAAGEFAFRKEAMGGGDVAMMAMVGAFLGWQSVVATIFAGAVVGIVLHFAGMLFRRPAAAEARPAGPARAADIEGMTNEELRAQGYLPFGVSLAIAAGVLAFVVGIDRVNGWFTWYAGMIGL